jgi:hypothetical protein
MKIRGSDGSKAPAVREVSLPRLKGDAQKAARGTTPDQVITTVARVFRAKNN